MTPEIIANASEIYAGLEVEDHEPYLPSNGTEGQIFMSRWCDRCTKESKLLQIQCPVLDKALCGNEPAEWIYYRNKPVCTAFRKRDSL